MTVRVLGALDVGGPMLSPRERTTLAVLVVRQGAAVSPAELAEALWPQDTPKTWAAQVKTAIARLRQRLGSGAIATRAGSYVFALDADAIDANRFERLVDSARDHVAQGEFDRAVDEYDRALALWRGEAYPDLADWEPGAAAARRLDEIRRDAEEERLRSRLHGRDAARLVPEADRLVRDAGLREERWALLAEANYRAGRQADALETLRTARERLLDELGLEPTARLTDLEAAILRQDPGLADDPVSVPVSAECPYRGLAAFAADDAELFFGRDPDLDLLVDRVRAGEVLTITGPSGSGKSSLAQAGLLARLCPDSSRCAVIRPSGAGSASLRAAVAREARIILVDQAEELLRRGDAEVEDFCAVCAQFLASGGILIVTVRSDFLDAATALPEIGAALGRGVYALAPIAPAAYREIIERPARRAGLRCEPGLVEVIVRDVTGRPASLPLASYALVETWARREGTTLTVAGYEAAGGIAGAVSASAEAAYRQLAPEEQHICRSLMLRLVARDGDGTTLRRHPPAAPLRSDPVRRAVLDRLADARLVTTEDDAIVIAHEAVAGAWPRLDAWLEEDARGARLLASVSAGAQAWDADGRPEDQLLRGARLALTREWVEQTTPDLTDVERAFVDESASKHQDRERALEARMRRDLRQNRTLRLALFAASILVVLAVVAGAVAAVRGREAAAAAREEMIQAITSRSLALRSTNRDVAALMSVAAVKRWPNDPRARAALAGTITAAGGFTGPTYIKDAVWRISAWPIPGTRQALVVRDQVNVEIDDLDSGKRLRTFSTRLPRPNTQVRPWVRVSADGSTALILQHFDGSDTAQTGKDKSERAWFFDVRTGRQIGRAIPVPNELAETVALSADGRFATWATIGPLVVLDRDRGTVRTRDDLSPLDWFEDSAASTFDSKGRIVLASRTGSIDVIDPQTLRTLSHRLIHAPGFLGRYVSVADDGTTLHQGGDGLLTVSPTGTELWRHPFDRAGECSRSAASSESNVATCGDERGHIEVRDLRTGLLRMPAANYQLGASGDLVFSRNGEELLLMSALAPAIGHLRVDGSGPASTAIASGFKPAGDFDSSGHLLLLASRAQNPGVQQEFAVWNVDTDRPVFRIPQDVRTPYRGILQGPVWADDHTLLVVDAVDPTLFNGRQVNLALDVRTGKLRPTGLVDGNYPVARSRDPKVLYAAEPTGVVVIDERTLVPTSTVFATQEPVVTISDDSARHRVAITQFNMTTNALETVVFDGRTGRRLATGLPTYTATALLDDKRLLGVATVDSGIFDATTLKSLHTIARVEGSFMIDVSEASHTALLYGSGDGGAQIIDTRSLTPIGDGMPAAVDTAGALSSDGTLAATAPLDAGVVIHRLDAKSEIAAACRLAGRELTAEEWKTYLASLGSQQTLCGRR
ncbi:hypothetical protein LK09_11655 [Microbacterium mangrovi]|uniref:OmpR/PhoB-type domain-containing protein n=1 Tax=Microbacterium mangrovi TaxID=1348253 RepID=A0A0B2A749_9MICO|nr:BTAD domain-containing putative transcriptional regulator [Microbacterium mangrovi]KHK97421.1 hypothetical protein LK09_11655 [Microbacterium mangrovi]